MLAAGEQQERYEIMNISTSPTQGLDDLSTAVGLRFACLDMKQRTEDALSQGNWASLARKAAGEAQKIADSLLESGVAPGAVRKTILTGEAPGEMGGAK